MQVPYNNLHKFTWQFNEIAFSLRHLLFTSCINLLTHCHKPGISINVLNIVTSVWLRLSTTSSSPSLSNIKAKELPSTYTTLPVLGSVLSLIQQLNTNTNFLRRPTISCFRLQEKRTEKAAIMLQERKIHLAFSSCYLCTAVAIILTTVIDWLSKA